MSNTNKWELFFDRAYFDMWAVRPINDKKFNSPRLFHFSSKEDAEDFKGSAEKSGCSTKIS